MRVVSVTSIKDFENLLSEILTRLQAIENKLIILDDEIEALESEVFTVPTDLDS